MNIEEFLKLKSEGKTNQQIADLWGVSISTIKRFIKKNDLGTKDKSINKEDFIKLYEQGLEDIEIAEKLGVTKSKITNYRKNLKLESQRDRQRKKNQELFRKLFHEGKNDSEIGRILGVSNSTIHYWREKLVKEKSNFVYSRNFDTNKFMEYYLEGLNYKEISERLKCSSSAIQDYASSLELIPNIYNKDVPTSRQSQIIIGSLLGDMSLIMPKNGKHACGSFAHSLKRENYCKWLEEELSNFCSKGFYKEQYDNRTNKVYQSYFVHLKASEYLTVMYHKFYPNGKKIVPKDLIYTLDGLGIAVWFMDDGYKNEGSFKIATNCFSDEDLLVIKEFFKTKFNIDISIHKDHTIYILAKSRENFVNLIKDYVHPDCLYKLAT